MSSAKEGYMLTPKEKKIKEQTFQLNKNNVLLNCGVLLFLSFHLGLLKFPSGDWPSS